MNDVGTDKILGRGTWPRNEDPAATFLTPGSTTASSDMLMINIISKAFPRLVVSLLFLINFEGFRAPYFIRVSCIQLDICDIS